MHYRYTLGALPGELLTLISEHLANCDLFNFALVSQYIYFHANRVLYRRDAHHGNSFAILWAASASGFSTQYAQAAIQTLRLSVDCGGNINTLHYRDDAFSSAFHVAVAHGNKIFIHELIRHQANTDSFSFRLWEFLNTGRFGRQLNSAVRLKSFATEAKIENHYWLPMLPAMFRSDLNIANVLASRGCPACLAFHHKRPYTPPFSYPPQISHGYTIHHLLVDQDLFPEHQASLFQRFGNAANLPERRSRMTPLMKAVQKANHKATDMLLSLPQELDALSSTGWPAISYAVQGASTLYTPAARDCSASLVKALLDKGANPNVRTWSSPLQLAATSLLDDQIATDPKHTRRMRQVVSDLLENGADVNVRMRTGQTLGQWVVLELDCHEPALPRGLLIEFLDHGMNANVFFPDGTSMLGRCLASDAINKPLLIALLYHGAQPTPQECDTLLYRWVRKDKTLLKEIKEKLPVFAVKFSQDAVDKAYTSIVLSNEGKRFDLLMEWRRTTTKPSQLLGTALRHKFSRRQDLYALPFDPTWHNKHGQGYGHIILDGLKTGIYTEKEAIKEMKQLLAKGLKLSMRDKEGMAVLQQLTALRQSMDDDAFGNLESLLTRSRLLEIGNEI